jgi:hypothetical protein
MTRSLNDESRLDETSSDHGRPSRPSSPHLHQSPLFGRMLIAIGIVVGIIGMLAMIMVFPLGEEYAESYFLMLPRCLQTVIATIPEGTPILLLMLPGGSMIVVAYVLVKRGRRHLVATYEASEPHVFRDLILYLRPFVSDESPLRLPVKLGWFSAPLLDKSERTREKLAMRGVSRYEELLAYASRRVGSFVTIGDPKEHLPQLGAARIYSETPDSTGSVDEEAWKIAVGRRIADARLVLLHIGISEGIRWEIEKVVEIADPQRIVLCVNPAGKLKLGARTLNRAFRAHVRDAWTQFRDACGAAFPHGLPEIIGDARFVRFDADWTARPLQAPKRKVVWFMPGRNPDVSRETIESALSWLTWIMVPEPFARRIARKCVNYITFMVTFVVMVVLLLFTVFALIDAFRQPAP